MVVVRRSVFCKHICGVNVLWSIIEGGGMTRNEEVRKLFTKGLFLSMCSMKKKHVINEEMCQGD